MSSISRLYKDLPISACHQKTIAVASQTADKVLLHKCEDK